VCSNWNYIKLKPIIHMYYDMSKKNSFYIYTVDTAYRNQEHEVLFLVIRSMYNYSCFLAAPQ